MINKITIYAGLTINVICMICILFLKYNANNIVKKGDHEKLGKPVLDYVNSFLTYHNAYDIKISENKMTMLDKFSFRDNTIYLSKASMISRNTVVLTTALYRAAQGVLFNQKDRGYLLLLKITKYSRILCLLALPALLVNIFFRSDIVFELCIWFYAISALLSVYMNHVSKKAGIKVKQYANEDSKLINLEDDINNCLGYLQWEYMLYVYEPIAMIFRLLFTGVIETIRSLLPEKKVNNNV